MQQDNTRLPPTAKSTNIGNGDRTTCESPPLLVVYARGETRKYDRCLNRADGDDERD